MLVDSLENWWLDFSKCLFIGDLSDPSDGKMLEDFTCAIVNIFKRHKKIVNDAEKTWLCLFLSSFCHLNHQQLLRGIMKTLNLSPRDKVLNDVQSYFRTIEQHLEKFKDAKRNPVILVLDKVYCIFSF